VDGNLVEVLDEVLERCDRTVPSALALGIVVG
jgi:hypothetical protein